jgi:DNA-binding response OmpR family regulator
VREQPVQGKTVLVIDDDAVIRKIVAVAFQADGAQVLTAAGPEEGLRIIQSGKPDLVILDIMMPDMDGYALCQEVRKTSDVPIIMLTALHADEEIVRGLEAGADDFISKPFHYDVLLARARAVLRRRTTQGLIYAAPYDDGYLAIDPTNHVVTIRNSRIRLTPTEHRLLEFLYVNSEKLMRLDEILDNVWGAIYQGSREYVHVYISHLRQKIEPDPRQPRYLQTEHGLGYRFVRQLP